MHLGVNRKGRSKISWIPNRSEVFPSPAVISPHEQALAIIYSCKLWLVAVYSSNEVFYTQILGNVIISCLHKIFSIKLIILSLAQAELTTAPTPATGSPVPALSPAKPSRPWSSLRSSRRTRTEAADWPLRAAVILIASPLRSSPISERRCMFRIWNKRN